MSKIIQIMPISGLYAKFKDKDGMWDDVSVDVLGLNEDGDIVPLGTTIKDKFGDVRTFDDFVRLSEERCEEKIIQIIPSEGMWAVFKDSENLIHKKRVEVLGLDEAGRIHPLCMRGKDDGYIFIDPREEEDFERFEIEGDD